MLLAELVVGTDDRALEEAPDAFYGVGVNVSADPFLGTVVDRFMPRVLVRNALVGLPLIGVDRLSIISDVGLDKCVKRLAVVALLDLEADGATTLDRADDDCFVVSVSPPLTPNLAAYVGLVNLYDTAEHPYAGIPHRSTDAVAEIPSRFVTNADHPFDLIGRDTLLRLTDNERGEKPCSQRQVRVMEDRASGYAELVMAGVAIKLRPILDWGDSI